jgi:BirA family biotin operon repressor/biotin-[acetyl-CoA-carboxylase] ligase
LLESRIVGDTATAVVAIGIGVNLAQRAFPAGLAARATSVAIEAGRAVARDAMLAGLLHAFDEWRARLEGDGMAPVRARWLALADTIGRRVSIDGVSGVAVDLDPDGALVLEDGGRRHRVVAGEVAEEAEHAARP